LRRPSDDTMLERAGSMERYKYIPAYQGSIQSFAPNLAPTKPPSHKTNPQKFPQPRRF
jgi:hypothetical protein